MAVEHIKHWKIGDVEVARIVEINALRRQHVDAAEGLHGRGVCSSTSGSCRTSATPEGKMLISFQCFVLRSRGKNVMIDTCIGADRKREYDVFCNLQSTFLEDLTAAGFPPETINTVLCTHLHFDHVGWNTKLVNGRWVPTFPQARYLFGKKEWDHWVHLKNTGGYHDFEHLHDSIDPVMEAGLVDFIGPEHQVTDEVSLFPTPGHTPGHVSVHIKSARPGGHHHRRHDASPDPAHRSAAAGNFDMDKEQGARTRQEFVDRFANTSALIIGSHFCDPTLGMDRERWRQPGN